MTLTQDMFNKIVTLILLIYTMGMFSLSWFFMRPLDLSSFMILIAPLLTHVVHITVPKQKNPSPNALQGDYKKVSTNFCAYGENS